MGTFSGRRRHERHERSLHTLTLPLDPIDPKKWRVRFLRYAPLLFWIAVILYLSTDNGSIEETSRFIRPLLHFLFPAAPEETLVIYHGYIRKAAHLTEYAILAGLAYRVFSTTVTRLAYTYLLPIVLVLIVASIDELNQSFISSRTGALADVGLDTLGGILGVSLVWLSRLVSNRAATKK